MQIVSARSAVHFRSGRRGSEELELQDPQVRLPHVPSNKLLWGGKHSLFLERFKGIYITA